MSTAQEAIRKFEKAGTPWLRPTDYYAEMVKTDQHMAKVKEQLMFEQKQIELAEERWEVPGGSYTSGSRFRPNLPRVGFRWPIPKASRVRNEDRHLPSGAPCTL